MSRESSPTLPWSSRFRPEVVNAGRFPMLEKSCGFVYHSSTIALHQHGYEGRLRIGDTPFELRPGDVTLTPAQVDSVYDLPRNGYHLCIHFRVPAHESPGREPALRLPLHVRLGAGSNSIRQRIWWITDLHRRAGHADPRKRALALAAASAGLQELMLTLALLEPAQPSERADGRVSSRLETALAIVVERIENRLKETLAVPALAGEAGLSQNYLARAFRQRYGLAIPRFILLRRIELARHLLATSKASIKQIASEVGLADVQHFNKQFRRLAGVSPSAYRTGHGTRLTVASSAGTATH
jgi:AraC-like DNA-binding protein